MSDIGMNNDLTDFVDIESTMPEGEESEASSELLSSIEEDRTDERVEKAVAMLSEFEKLKFKYDASIVSSVSEAVFPAIEQREEYLKAIASRLYDEIYKQAKTFLKTWCKINKYEQKWSTPLKKKKAKLSHMSEFVPQTYSLSLFNEMKNETLILADMMVTAREASIYGAKRLGFDNSNERKLAFSKFSALTVDLILKDSKYLEEQRELNKFEEYRKQIDTRRYVPQSLRDKWRKELEEKTTLMNGVI